MLLFDLPLFNAADVWRSRGQSFLHYFSPLTLGLKQRCPFCAWKAVHTLWMTCCINQCLNIMILNIFKLEKKHTTSLFWSSAMGGKLVEKIACCRIAFKKNKKQKNDKKKRCIRKLKSLMFSFISLFILSLFNRSLIAVFISFLCAYTV